MSICLEKNNPRHGIHRAVALLPALLITACAHSGMMTMTPMRDPVRKVQDPYTMQALAKQEDHPRSATIEKIRPLQRPNIKVKQTTKLTFPKRLVQLNADALPLNRFIHMALGDVLHIPFTMDPAIASRVDPVTLHIAQPIAAKRAYLMVKQALAMFDVALVEQDHDDALLVLPASKAPLEVVGHDKAKLLLRAGKVMELIPLRYITGREAGRLQSMFFPIGSSFGTVWYDDRLHGLVAIGDPDVIHRFKVAMRALDTPSIGGREIRLVHPVYWSAKELAGSLRKVLNMQGVPIHREGVQLILLERLNALIVVSTRREWMRVALDWIKKFDRPEAVGNDVKSFVYGVRYGQASKIGAVIRKIIDKQRQATTTKKKAKKVTTQNKKPLLSSRLVVDDDTNLLFFIGTAREYQQILPLIRKLDKPLRQVLIEATVAEVVLDNANKFGIEAGFSNVDHSRTLQGTLSTLGGLGIGSSGLVYTLSDLAGAIRLKLNALASEGKARVLSSPRLLAVNRQTANIQIGDQIAVLTQQVSDAQATNGVATGILQNFTYINTGVILSVTPYIGDNGSIRMKVQQEVSSPGASANNTPPISKRSVNTEFVAHSGQTVLIGGLISHQVSGGRTKVPLLGDIPLVGHLFSSDSQTDHSVELIVLITPHVIESVDEMSFYLDEFRRQMREENL